MPEMQWRKANGETGSYSGPLVALGHGIPRKAGSFGVRRAIYDAAFGYVSGFPVRDIFAFSVRSLFPQRTLSVVAADAIEPYDGYVGTANIQCPVCGAIVPATVTAEIVNGEDQHLGGAEIVCAADTSDIYAHMWAHGQEESNGR